MKKRKGQSVVEFALVLPLFLLIMFGVIYTGMLFHDYITVSNIARTSAREAAVTAKDEYGTIATHYEGQLDELMTNFYKKADSNPIVIVPVDHGSDSEGVQSTINMQLNDGGYFLDMIFPSTIKVRYYMKKEPYTSSST
jgi:Flp pilus assembly protein TadG